MSDGAEEAERPPRPGDPAVTAAPTSLDDPRVVQDVEAYCAALRRGERPDRGRLIEKYPGLAQDLRECLDGLDLIQRIDPRLVPDEAGDEAGAMPRRGTLGDFQILREIGCGGMGVVYEAEQISLGRRVALKVLPFAAMLDPRHLLRFQNEARAAASLHHPNIVAVHAVGCDRGVHFYAMECIEGQSLARVIHELRQLSDLACQVGLCPDNAVSEFTRRLVSGDVTSVDGEPTSDSRLSLRERPCFRGAKADVDRRAGPTPQRPPSGDERPAGGSASGIADALSSADSTRGLGFYRAVARLGIQAAEALAHAHELGVVHRDIKPSNLLVDARGHLWITDFGLAQTQATTNLTMTGDLVGTLRYMSPEQTLGHGDAVDCRTDIYSLGVTLYELLTRQPPFDAEERPAILRQIVEGEVKPLRRVDPNLPRDLETIVLKAMATEADRRYAAAQELADDLRRFLEHRPILARRPTVLEHLGKWSQRNRVLVLAAAVFLALSAVVSTVSSFLVFGARNEAVQQRDLANDRQRLADQSRRIAEQRASELREQVYAADIKRAHLAWRRAEVQWAIDLLKQYQPRAGEPDLRGFEWHYVWSLCHPQQRALQGHAGDVYSFAFAPDGKTLASAGQDGTVRVWDLARGAQRYCLSEPRGEIVSVAFSPDGQRLASACGQGTVLVSEAATGKEVVTLRACEGEAYSVTFSPDGQLLATSGVETTVKLWNTSTWNEERTLTGHESHVQGLAFSPDGKTLATGSGDRTVRLWDVATGRARAILEGRDGEVLSVAFSADGKWLASANRDQTVMLWDPTTGQRRSTLRGHTTRVNQVAFSPDNRLLVSASKDGTVRLWDVTTGAEVGNIRAHLGRSWCVGFSADGVTMATSGTDGLVRLWDPVENQEYRRCPLHDLGINAIAFGPEDTIWACTSTTVERWDFRSGAQLTAGGLVVEEDYAGSPNSMCAAAFLPDGRTVATGMLYGGQIKLRDVWSQRVRAPLTVNAGTISDVTGIAVSLDGSTLACSAENENETVRSIRLWDLNAGCRLSVLPVECGVHYLAFAPDGRALFAGCADNSIRRWDVASRQPLPNIHGHQNAVFALAISPDGRLLASGGSGRKVRLWDLHTGQQIGMLVGHADAVNALAFAPNAKTLASGSKDGSVRLWSVSTGLELLSLEMPPLALSIEDLAFSRDGKNLAAGCASIDNRTEIHVWSAHMEPSAADGAGSSSLAPNTTDESPPRSTADDRS